MAEDPDADMESAKRIYGTGKSAVPGYFMGIRSEA